MFEGARGKVMVVDGETKYEHGKKITTCCRSLAR